MVSRLRKNLVRAAVPFAHALSIVAGGTAAIEAVQPSEDVRITAVNVEMTTSSGNGVSLFGEQIASTYLFDERVDVKLIDKADYPKAIEETVEIFGSGPSQKPNNRSKDNLSPVDRLAAKYEDDISSALLRLGIKNVLVFSGGALAGSLVLQSGIWHYRHRNDRDPGRVSIIRRAGIPLGIALAVSSSVNCYNLMNVVTDPHTLARAENVASAPVDEYLVTSTSNMAANLDTITTQISLDLQRLTTIDDALKSGSSQANRPQGETHTYLIVADSHNLPTAPQTIQDLMRATNADGIIALGDFVDVGIQPEIDALSGITVGETTFSGWDDIRSCATQRKDGTCEEPGEQYLMYALVGNHDPSTLMDTLKSLGFKDLSVTTPPGLTDMVALSDACPVDLGNIEGRSSDAKACSEDYKKRNETEGEKLYKKMKQTQQDDREATMPNIAFFASDSAAKPFVGNVPIIFVGGTHQATSIVEDGSTIIEVPSVGQGGARSAKYAGAVLATFTTDASGGITLGRCLDLRWNITTPGKESVRQCLN